jgi:biopolymer transport protein ExbD
MSIITDIITYVESRVDIIQLLAVLLVSFIIFIIFIKILKRNLLKKVKTKKQISNVTVFLSLLKLLLPFSMAI